ncbi:MAG: outer membrane beta-barrel protein [Bdellovibrionaceae bacterium]|nr:outer membrane beta-barrel protein [Bdellovibrio sp.]
MKTLKLKIILSSLFIFLFHSSAFALLTELGLSYSYQKKTFNATNYYQSDSKGASVSLYFLEKLALELSYTDAFYESQESDVNSTRTVQQSTTVFDSSLIFALLDKKSFVQPYIKAGAAYIKKSQKVRYLNANTMEIPTSAGWAPSYGAGLKFLLSERFSIKLGYDVWQTSLSDGSKSDDSALKAGLSWYL